MVATANVRKRNGSSLKKPIFMQRANPLNPSDGESVSKARAPGIFRVSPPTFRTALRYLQFGCVGGTGVLVDMAALFLLADARTLHWPLTLSKALAAEIALLNNFIWNELWTFREQAAVSAGVRARLSRLCKFNVICAAGIGLSVLLLNAQVRGLGMNVYAANLVSIFLVSLWNFGMTLKFGWGRPAAGGGASKQ